MWRVPDEASVDDLALAHDPGYVAAVEAFCLAGGGQLDPDTSATPGSWPTARRSAGAVLGAIGALRNGECDVAFAAGRPPGHHAVRDRAMGFCLFNNAAVGAASLAARGARRVAIVDWDVHHGNGTQDIFYTDPRGALRLDAPVAAVPGHRPAAGDGRRVPANGRTSTCRSRRVRRATRTAPRSTR